MAGLFYFKPMKMIIRNGLMLILTMFFAASVYAQKPAATVPLFTFYQLDGKAFTKANLSPGKNSMFIFFDVSCEHCQRLIAEVNTKYTLFKRAQFYFVSMYEPQAIRNFMVRYAKNMNGKRNVVLLQDKNKEFIPKFMPEKYPAIYVYSPKGNLIRYFSGEKKVDEIIVAANTVLK